MLAAPIRHGSLNSEVGDLGGFTLSPEPLFSFERYDVNLERDWLKRELGLAIGLDEITAVSAMDNAMPWRSPTRSAPRRPRSSCKPEHLGLG